MEGVAVVALLGGLVVGLLLGALAGLAVARARRDTDTAQADAYLAHTRTELAHAQTLIAQSRTEAAAGARPRRPRSREPRSPRFRADVAEARSEASAAQAEAAEVSAAVARAVAQRDAALERANEIAADREAMLNQFKVLSAETLDRQGKAADAQAEVRLKATEQLMVAGSREPGQVQLPAHRGGEGAGRPCPPSCASRSRMSSRPGRPCAGRRPPW